jgi:hypothetical protein
MAVVLPMLPNEAVKNLSGTSLAPPPAKEKRTIPGSFAFALDAKFKNDEVGASA